MGAKKPNKRAKMHAIVYTIIPAPDSLLMNINEHFRCVVGFGEVVVLWRSGEGWHLQATV